MSPGEKPDERLPPAGRQKDDRYATTFAFVNDQTPQDSRSHAMREYWKQRRRTKSVDAGSSSRSAAAAAGSQANMPPVPPLTLRPGRGGTASASSGSGSSRRPTTSRSPKKVAIEPGISAQVLSGMNLALGNCRLDPFDQFPIKLTAQHHKLILHWLTMYATMMFGTRSRAKFNPLRDVFFPLDLSNAAAFNAVMAQSAAHLARMQGRLRSTEALQFKAEAIRILSEWMADDKMALSDDVLAAVSRILAYERYWGTEAEWLVHRAGLQRLIDQRGGVGALQNNWRLELTIYLISLMSKPSWFDSSNQLWELSDSSMSAHAGLHTLLGSKDALARIRSLWLISFIQDTRTLMNNWVELYSDGITIYAALQRAVAMLHAAIPASIEAPRGTHFDQHDYTRIACILFIVLLIQSSTSIEPPQGTPSLTRIAQLDALLLEREPQWTRSVDELYDTLYHHFAPRIKGTTMSSYALHMATVMSYMSVETRRGVERTLLHILPHVPAESWQDDCQWTPDVLLSSIHGD
ncbi:hypothetical protein CCM_07731 [Cordyceps militaris CM01]|uniref:Tachykinin family protein n=1 Tax=Cordyceps militaris (strain CM01) TaxID=983644 RepID=G3JQH5_CORMM|nr:uncharacterized protein CCM_07731 [Cordyceps militaris CM01]EGX89479.1 hypothetical protein CCM_07731 [Cordyceps militaris CM01]